MITKASISQALKSGKTVFQIARDAFDASTDYQIWLTANGEKTKIMLPVNPETFTVNASANNSTVNIVGLGEITVMQGRKALQFSFSSFFPATYFPGCKVSNPPSPKKMVDLIRGWMDDQAPIHFVATSAAGVDLYCTIESFKFTESGGDVGTISYTMQLKEYREVTTRQVSVNTEKKTATVKNTAQRVDNTQKSSTYTVKDGDCLWNIAKRLYGDGSKYTVIYNANKSVIGGNPNLIYSGQVLTIPDV